MVRMLVAAVATATIILAAAEEEEMPDEKNYWVSNMLLGSLLFFFGTLQMTATKNKRRAERVWSVISATISIFCAVLFFQTIRAIVVAFILGDDASSMKTFIVGVIHFLIWFVVFQLVLGKLSGALWEDTEYEELEDTDNRQRLLTRCWGVLFGHLAGFASISAWAALQQMMAGWGGSGSLGHLYATVAIAISVAVLCLMIGLSKMFRAAVAGEKVDEDEQRWLEESEETENDVVSLTVSFLVVQVFRWIIEGELPNQEGEIEGAPAENMPIFFLGLLGIGIKVVCMNVPPFLEGEEGPRYIKFKCDISAMIMAWCIFFTVFRYTRLYAESEGEAIQGVTNAMTITLIGAVATFCLQWLAGQDWTNKKFTKDLRKLADVVAILIGFGWERCFDTAVDTIAARDSAMVNPLICKTVLAALCILCVLPPWRRRIVPHLMKIEKEKEEEDEKRKEASGEGYQELGTEQA